MSSTAPPAPGTAPGPEAWLLAHPRDGIPPLVASAEALAAAADALAAGSGPLAVDAERASGYRYFGRAYLIQLRREGAGTVLVDPIAVPDLSPIGDRLAGVAWVLHAANQDLACLAEVGLAPRTLFDTELAGRLTGHPRVALGTLTEELLGIRLAKEHSAADWSQRPLPRSFLAYAALDVELLVDLREVLAGELAAQGKTEWAAQEFAGVLAAPAPAARAEPWRRTSGIHQVRSRRGLAAVRAVWTARDELARSRDRAPGRVLPDRLIVALAAAAPASFDDVRRVLAADPRAGEGSAGRWWDALRQARQLPEPDLPLAVAPFDGPPPASRWADRDVVAAGRLARSRERLAAVAHEAGVPAENLLSPDLLRRVAWSPPGEVTPDTVGAALVAGRARPWQVALTATALAEAFTAAG